MQRAGRAGRSPDINARGILLCEESMFKRKRRPRNRQQVTMDGSSDTGEDFDTDERFSIRDTHQSEEEEADDDESIGGGGSGGGDNGTGNVTDTDKAVVSGGEADDDDGKEWGKKVDENLREWIEAVCCRRDVADNYFDNPPGRKREYTSWLSYARF